MPYVPPDPPWLDTRWTTPMFKSIEKTQSNVKRILAIPCAPDYALYVELAAPALIKAFADVLSPDPKEVFHKVNGKSFACTIEAGVKDAVNYDPEQAGKFTRFLFNFPKFADLAVWYLFLADVAAEGIFNWSTMALRQGKCADPSNPHFGQGSLYAGSLYNDGAWLQSDFGFPVGSDFYPVSPGGVNVRPGRTYICTQSIQFKVGNVGVATNHRIMCYGTDTILDQDTNDAGDGQSERAGHVFVKGRNTTGEILIVEAQSQYVGEFSQVFADSGATCSLLSGDY